MVDMHDPPPEQKRVGASYAGLATASMRLVRRGPDQV